MVRIEEVKTEQYRQYVIDLVKRYVGYKPRYGEVELEAVMDHEHGHYEVITIGWENDERVHGCLLHIDLKDNKLWIQHDGTDAGIANLLVEMGVPKEDIVLGFQPLYKRPYTGFAVN
ncbi:MAG: XisI protein [Chloroflexi bacterium]|nr:MAG: XisI protein [Chloroflexota bacterium]